MRRLIKPLLGLLGRIAVIVAASLALLAFMMQEYVLGCILLLLVTMAVINNLQLIVSNLETRLKDLEMAVINNLQLIISNLKTRLKDLEGKKEQDKAEINLLNSKLSLLHTIDKINEKNTNPTVPNKRNAYVTSAEAAILMNIGLRQFYRKYRKDPNFPKPVAVKQGLTIPRDPVLFDKKQVLQFAEKIKIEKNETTPTPAIKILIGEENYISVGGVSKILGISPSTFYLKYRKKTNFPKPIKRIVPGIKNRIHLYKEAEILRYKQRYV